MAPKGQKKAFDNGVLCGLRSDTPTVPPKSPRPSLTKEDFQGVDQPVAPITASPRPQSLTLPFQNRDRASHLISDEEFDRIMRQSELDRPVPRLSSGIPSHLSGFGIRRTASTAKGSRTSLFAQRPRPASANFSNTVHAAAHDSFPRPGFSRDPTLTALPRPPTKNDMAIYPSQNNINFRTTTSAINDTLRDSTAPTPTSRSQTPALQAPSGWKSNQQDNRRGHKRQFSLTLAAANMVESVKKRIKRPDSPSPRSMCISSPMKFSTQTDRNSRSTTPYTFPSSPIVHPNHDPNFMIQVSSNSDATFTTAADANANANIDDNPTTTPTPTSARPPKSALQRTWSLTKDTARETRTLITPITRLINRPKEPTFVEVFPSSLQRTTPSSLTLNDPTPPNTGSTTNTSAYFGSAESSPFLTSSGHFYGNPANIGAARPKPWLTAPREVLGGEIEKLENRTMELVARNEGYSREIEYLRGRIGILEAGGGGGGDGSGAVRWRSGLVGGAGMGAGVGVGGTAMQMDEHEHEEIDTEMGEYDKRKTWLTCHSEEDEDEHEQHD